MRVGFDAKRATMNFTGLGNYCRAILIHLGKYFPENDYILYTPGLKNPERYPEILQGKPYFLRFPKGLIKKYFSSFWRTYLVNRELVKEEIEIFHGLSGELPWGRKDKDTLFVLTIHDLIFFRFPEFYKPLDRLIYRLKARYAVQKADQIIAISEQTRNDIVQFLKVNPKKIKVIYQACAQIFYQSIAPLERIRIREAYQIPKRYILYVGTLEPRKRSLELLKAFNSLSKDLKIQVELVLVGKKTSYFLNLKTFISENHLEEKVHFFHDIPLKDLPGFYQMAEVFVYPSTFEGFGLPILEALVSEVPVITSEGSCFSEAGGESSIYLNPDDTQNFANTLARVLEDKELQESMKRKGLEHSRKFEAGALAQQLMEVYNTMRIE